MSTIIIETTEQAEAFMQHLMECKQFAEKDNYANERKKRIRWMTCTCCGESYRGRQWWNQDTGYGMGDCCVDFCKVDRATPSECYGVPGIHFLIPSEDLPK